MGSYMGNELPDGNLLSDVLLWTVCTSDFPPDFPSWRKETAVKIHNIKKDAAIGIFFWFCGINNGLIRKNIL